MNKRAGRLKRARRTRLRIKTQARSARLSVNRTGVHMYAQILQDRLGASTTLLQASTLDKEIRKLLSDGMTKTEQASLVGKAVAERALAAGVERVVFDRSGFQYHGRVKALADAARAAGLNF